MGIHQERVHLAETEEKEAMLNFCNAEADLDMALGIYYEAKEVLSRKRAAVEQAITEADLDLVEGDNV